MPEKLLNQSKESRFGVHCGITAVFSESGSAPQLARNGLMSIQTRGQEAAGLSAYVTDEYIECCKGFGFIPTAVTDADLKRLGRAKIAIAHNRYSTVETGRDALDNVQPIVLQKGPHKIGLGHNGNLFHTDLFAHSMPEGATQVSDSYIVTSFLLRQRPMYADWKETLIKTLPVIAESGAFSFAIMTESGELFAAKDPYGIRPLCIGQLDDGWMFASESVAIDVAGGQYLRKMTRGELISIDSQGRIDFDYYNEPKPPRDCIFERVYFARPDSFMDGQFVETTREESGMRLGRRLQELEIHPDVVVPVLNSGGPAAIGVARALGVPCKANIKTDLYGRTFILPGQPKRKGAINDKHHVIPVGLQGESVLFVDDSSVRVNTGPKINTLLKTAGARETHAAFASGPVVAACDMGVDMEPDRLPAALFRDQPLIEIEMAINKRIGADSTTYLPIEQVAEAAGKQLEHFCHYCFGGPHPIRDEQTVFPPKEKIIPGKPKIDVCISGSGTNLQRIIDLIETGVLEADLVRVISNDPLAYGLQRALRHNIPVAVFSSRGKLKDHKLRVAYETQLLEQVKKDNPDVLVLAGFMFVLSDDFLRQMQDMETVVTNLHPAFLTRDKRETVTTSRGVIPVLRGIHMIEEAYNRGMSEMPVSGVTVHQVVPADGQYDVGPIILQEEVRRIDGETLEQWEKRIHDAEHRILPAALKRVLHVIGHHVDVSKGNFPW